MKSIAETRINRFNQIKMLMTMFVDVGTADMLFMLSTFSSSQKIPKGTEESVAFTSAGLINLGTSVNSKITTITYTMVNK